jgi:hypothetical protein
MAASSRIAAIEVRHNSMRDTLVRSCCLEVAQRQKNYRNF